MDTENPDAPLTIPEQAGAWILELRENPGAETNARFFEWVKTSSTHLLMFMEMLEVERRFKRLSPEQLHDIRNILDRSDVAR